MLACPPSLSFPRLPITRVREDRHVEWAQVGNIRLVLEGWGGGKGHPGIQSFRAFRANALASGRDDDSYAAAVVAAFLAAMI